MQLSCLRLQVFSTNRLSSALLGAADNLIDWLNYLICIVLRAAPECVSAVRCGEDVRENREVVFYAIFCLLDMQSQQAV
eukprot:scaffold197217_cov37-Prasinocladus_malaysianus.AAC.1